MAAHHPGRAGGRGADLGRALFSQPHWPTRTETSSDGPERMTVPPNLLFPFGSSQLSMFGPAMPGWGSGCRGAVVKAGVSLLLAVL